MNKTFDCEVLKLDNTNAKELFSAAFSEKAENTERLFNTLLKNSLHFTLKIDNTLVSQLFLIESEVVLDKKYPIYYLYAAATKDEFRGLGLMHELIDFAKKQAIKNGKCGIVLKPANSGLFKFYASCGFNKILYSDIYEYSLKNKDTSCKNLTAKEYLIIREKLLNNTPHIVLKQDLEDGLNNHYYIYGNENSICLLERYTEIDTAFIAEKLGNDDSLEYAIKSLNCTKAIVKSVGENTAFSVIWLNNIKEPQYNIYHGPCFE